MWYKPNVNAEGRSGSTYFTYGNPGYDKTKGRGDFTYINWSWVQNGGDQYPENICRGGGMVRAIGKRGMTFVAADVEAVIGYSYGADNKINGRVTAFYGRATAGPGDGGTEIFGWLPHSYQKNDDIIVPCVRRSMRARQMVTPPASTDRMERMARNLLYETPANAEARAKLVKEIAGEREAQMRIELLTQLSSMDDAATVRALLDIIARDADARVREQAIVLIGYMAATPGEMNQVCDGLLKNFQRSDDARERLRTIEIVGNIPSEESKQFLNLARGVTSSPGAKSPEEFKAIEEALARMAQRP
jgi:hypothetical protein